MGMDKSFGSSLGKVPAWAKSQNGWRQTMSARTHLWSSTALAVALLVLVATLGLARLYNSLTLGEAGLPPLGSVLPSPQGYSETAQRIDGGSVAPCTLVHFSATGCEFCRTESRLWVQAARQGRSIGCRVVSVAPYVGQSVDPATIVFVPMAWARAVWLNALPTTLLMDRAGQLVWSQTGALDQRTESRLTRAMSRVTVVASRPNARRQP